eukprot:gnl/Dysnectes_brevis/1103_a1234_1767.p1 GENE.gnl/Dysnectes_brevis/1103_a1234_1767~~gnl/Dysnectes_brevis/1103_a1234_1767.p1  ORF type:complete len:482 (+),score=115.87 gnl/Dysnectes_brevis/1103_a1234_1767:35-1480(+)
MSSIRDLYFSSKIAEALPTASRLDFSPLPKATIMVEMYGAEGTTGRRLWSSKRRVNAKEEKKRSKKDSLSEVKSIQKVIIPRFPSVWLDALSPDFRSLFELYQIQLPPGISPKPPSSTEESSETFSFINQKTDIHGSEMPTCSSIARNPYDICAHALAITKGGNILTSLDDAVFLVRFITQLPAVPTLASITQEILLRSPLIEQDGSMPPRLRRACSVGILRASKHALMHSWAKLNEIHLFTGVVRTLWLMARPVTCEGATAIMPDIFNIPTLATTLSIALGSTAHPTPPQSALRAVLWLVMRLSGLYREMCSDMNKAGVGKKLILLIQSWAKDDTPLPSADTIGCAATVLARTRLSRHGLSVKQGSSFVRDHRKAVDGLLARAQLAQAEAMEAFAARAEKAVDEPVVEDSSEEEDSQAQDAVTEDAWSGVVRRLEALREVIISRSDSAKLNAWDEPSFSPLVLPHRLIQLFSVIATEGDE